VASCATVEGAGGSFELSSVVPGAAAGGAEGSFEPPLGPAVGGGAGPLEL
jgi:hypothetical protein